MCERLRRSLLLLAIALASRFSARETAAQWLVEAGIGRSSHEAVASQLDGENFTAGLRYAGTRWLDVTGGVSVSEYEQRWASVAGGGQWDAIPSAGVSLFAAAQMYGFSWELSDRNRGSGWGGVLEASPRTAISAGGVDIEVGAGGVASWIDEAGDFQTRFLPSAEASLWLGEPSGASARLNARYLYEAGNHFPFLGAEGSYELGKGGVWARFGKWFSAEVDEPQWSAGVYAQPLNRVQLHLAMFQETNEPVYRTPPRRSWSLAASFQLGASRGTAVPSLPLEMAEGEVVIRIPNGEVVGAPSIAGDFTGWVAQPMQLEGGEWIARFDLRPGLYRFSLVSSEGDWFLPASFGHRVPDGFGGENALLVVR